MSDLMHQPCGECGHAAYHHRCAGGCGAQYLPDENADVLQQCWCPALPPMAAGAAALAEEPRPCVTALIELDDDDRAAIAAGARLSLTLDGGELPWSLAVEPPTGAST